MHAVIKKIREIGIVPVIKIERLKDAFPLGKALCEGGLPVAEITFRTEHAKQAMQILHEQLPQMLLGAGTVLTMQQVDDALEAGAEFIVSPGFNPDIVSYCQQKQIPIIPGCANASDIEQALHFGLETVKFFPAEPLGGLPMIKALAAPYGNMTFMPTGGVKESNIVDYLSYEKIVACGGTWMIDAQAIQNGDFAQITKLTRQAVKAMLGLKLAHVGINADAQQYQSLADEFSKLLLCDTQLHSSSCFAGDSVEVMRQGKGMHGHLGYAVNDVARAVRYYESIGYHFLMEEAIYDVQGTLKAVYFEKELGGWHVHLMKK